MNEVDEHVRASLLKTHGNLYRGARLTRYPIPSFPLPPARSDFRVGLEEDLEVRVRKHHRPDVPSLHDAPSQTQCSLPISQDGSHFRMAGDLGHDGLHLRGFQ